MTVVADTTIEIFDVNDTVTLRFEVADVNGNLADPPSFSGWYTKPGAALRTAVTFIRQATGIYEFDLPLDTEGDWWWRAETTGDGTTIKAQAGERTFHV